MWETLFAAPMLVLYAGAVFTLAYLIINQVMLRITVLIGTAFYIWYYAVVADTPLWEAIWTSIAMGVANLIGLGGLYWQQSKWAIPKRDKDLSTLFPSMPPGDFRALMHLADRFELDTPLTLTTEGAPADYLYYVVSGKISVQKMGEVFFLPPNLFVGEVAYLTGRRSAATSELDAGAEVLRWSVADLRAKSKRKTRFKLALEAMISNDLALKVAGAVAPHQTDTRAASLPREAVQT